MWTNFDEVFLNLDVDQNQMLDLEEFLKTPAHPLLVVSTDKAFLIADADGDGLVNLTEWFHVFILFNNVLMKTTTEDEWRRYTYYMQDTLAIPVSKRKCWAGPKICDILSGPVDTTREMSRGPSIDEVDVGDMSAEKFYNEYLSQNKPVLIKKGSAHWKAFKLWTDDYLKEKVGGERVNAERSKTNRYGYEDKSWHGVLPNATTTEPEDQYTWNKFLNVYQAASNEHETNFYISSNIPMGLAGDVELPTSLVPCLMDRHEWTILWMGGGGQNSLLHNDQFDNLYGVLAGRKKVMLIDPTQSPYLYEDKYIMAKGKVSEINFEKPDYEKHPFQRYLSYQEVTVEAGDILFIPLYWWHQVKSEGRSIGVTHWFDMWKKSSLVGSGRGSGSERLVRTFKAHIQLHGSKCPEVKSEASPLSNWKGCRYATALDETQTAGACLQVTARHDFCSSSNTDVSTREDSLVKQLLDLWQESNGDTAPQPEIENAYSRQEVNAAVGVLAPCDSNEQSVRYTEFVEYVGDVLYFNNPTFAEKVKEAVSLKDGSLEALVEGFSKEELLRLLLSIFDDPALDNADIAEKIHREYWPVSFK